MQFDVFQMERYQSTWEKDVEYDMAESGIRPVTVRELVGMGFDLDAVLDMPLGYNRTNGTLELRERIAAHYADATADNILVTNGTSEANFLVALTLVKSGDAFAFQTPNYMQMWGLPRSLGATVKQFRLQPETHWEPDWDEFDRAVGPGTRLVYISNPNNPTGSVLSDVARKRIVARCETVGAWLISDEVYLGAEIDRERTLSFWGTSEKVIVTCGLSKAYGIPGLRIGWIVAPKDLVHDCWARHDYTTIAPGRLSDVMACIAVEGENRERLFDRTRAQLKNNLQIVDDWIKGFGCFLSYRPPEAGAICLVKYDADIPSPQLAERIRQNQNTLVVPGSYVGLEGYLRLWFGGPPEYVAEGLRRVKCELNVLR